MLQPDIDIYCIGDQQVSIWRLPLNRVTLSSDITPDVCRVCQCDICQYPAFDQGTLCSSASSMPMRNNLDDDIPELVPKIDTKDTTNILYPSDQSPSDEEADREVAAICKAPVFYRMTQKGRRRHRYYFYSPLDNIEESRRGKRKGMIPHHCRDFLNSKHGMSK